MADLLPGSFSPQPTLPDISLAMGNIPAASHLGLKPSQVAGMGRSSSPGDDGLKAG